MDAMKETILTVKDLRVIYSQGKKTIEAVNDVSFTLESGKTLALVGETGAGKTTILKSILGILPNPPAKLLGGEVLFEGKDLMKLDEKSMESIRGNRISMIFQDPMTALNPLMTVGDQIMENLQTHEKMTKETAKKRAGELLEMVGIPAIRFSEYPFEFSGGMKQRVVIAMSLACNPVLLLADEPTTALDVTIQSQVLDLINELKERNHTSMVLVTHDLGVVAETSDNVAVVYAGEIIEYGTKEDIFIHTAHPYTKGLFNSLPGVNPESRRLSPIPGSMPDPTALPAGCMFAPRCPYATDACRENRQELKEVSQGHLCRCSNS